MRSIALLAILLTCASASIGATPDEQSAESRFEAIHEREWAWRMGEFPLLATGAGVHEFNDRLGKVDEAAQRRRLRYWRAVEDELSKIDPEQLSPAAKINYRIYRDQIESLIGGVEVKSYLLPLNSDSSFYGELEQLPRSQPFENERDYDNYLRRLGEIPAYFDAHIELLSTGLKFGISVPQVVLLGRDNALSKQAALERPEASVYFAPFERIPQSVPPEAQQALRERAIEVIGQSVTPAYGKLLRFSGIL